MTASSRPAVAVPPERWRHAVVVAALALLFAGSARSQDDDEPSFAPPDAGDGRGSVRGSVRGPDGEPLAGAAVEILVEAGDARRATTDAKGRFALLDLPAGNLPIRVVAAGCLPSEGFVRAAVGVAAPAVEIELRSLDEGSPRFAEGDPRASARGWIERANALLEQDRVAEAAVEYEKALQVLAGAERAPVLRALARTAWLEGRAGDSVRALEQALVADPQLAETRRLYRAVMDELGRGAAADRFLADLPRLAAEAARAPPAEAPPAAPAAPPPAPVEPAAHRTGELTVHGVERSPLSAVEQIAGHFGVTRDAIRDEHPRALEYHIENESFDLYVPESYRAGEPWGVVVWVSPGERGGLRNPEVRELLGTRRLLWIGANASSNRRARFDRAGLALDALHLAQTFYDVDPERVFVAGYSGGGRMASQLAFLFPEVFRGAVCWFGVDHFRPLPVPYRPGYHFPPGFPAPSDERLSAVRRRGRYALVTGQRDFNRSETRAVHAAWLQERIHGAAYFEIPDADHYHGLDAGWLARALDHVEAR